MIVGALVLNGLPLYAISFAGMKVGEAPLAPANSASATPVPICVDFAHFESPVGLILHDGNNALLILNPLLNRTTIDLAMPSSDALLTFSGSSQPAQREP